MSVVAQAGKSMVVSALLTGAGAYGLNQLGLAKKVMRTSAPFFAKACIYGATRGAIAGVITGVSVYLQKETKKNWAKIAIGVGALGALYLSVAYTRQFTKDHLGVKVPEQFAYLALLAEFGSIYYNGLR